MKPSRRTLFLSRRMLLSCSCVVLSYRSDWITAGVTLVVPWILFSVGIVGIVSWFWFQSVGPVPVDYERVFARYDRLSSPVLAALYLRLCIHSFWVLQALSVLADVYPTTARPHHEEDESVMHQRRAG